jgi:hypothetical protein
MDSHTSHLQGQNMKFLIHTKQRVKPRKEIVSGCKYEQYGTFHETVKISIKITKIFAEAAASIFRV